MGSNPIKALKDATPFEMYKVQRMRFCRDRSALVGQTLVGAAFHLRTIETVLTPVKPKSSLGAVTGNALMYVMSH